VMLVEVREIEHREASHFCSLCESLSLSLCKTYLPVSLC
jgi:hypothetical protein